MIQTKSDTPENTHQLFPKRRILDSSKLNEFADNNFEFDKKWQKVLQTFRKGVNDRITFNLLPPMPILGSSSSAANIDMMSKIWTNEDTVI